MSMNQKLRQLAEVLPKVQKFEHGKPKFIAVRVLQTGEEILQHDMYAKDAKGNTIKADANYSKILQEPVYVNHFKELQKAKRLDVENGVKNYIKKIAPNFKLEDYEEK